MDWNCCLKGNDWFLASRLRLAICVYQQQGGEFDWEHFAPKAQRGSCHVIQCHSPSDTGDPLHRSINCLCAMETQPVDLTEGSWVPSATPCMWVPIAAVTNNHKPSSFRQHAFVTLQFWPWVLWGSNQGSSWAAFLLEAPEKGLILDLSF